MTSSTTDKLLDAAEYRMRRGGYNAVSFRDLAADAEIKSSSVHYHYPKKEDLGVALVERYGQRFFENLGRAVQNKNSVRERIEIYRQMYRRALIKDEAICLCGLLGSEMAGLPDCVGDAVRVFFAANIDWVANCLPPTLPNALRQETAASLVATFQGALMLATSMQDVVLFDRATMHALEVMIDKDW